MESGAGGGFAAAAGGFDDRREEFIARIEDAREGWRENELADVMEQITQAAAADLESQEGDLSDEEIIVSVEAWASLLSYASSRFYYEGPESLFKGGYDKRVVKRLQDAAKTLSPFLKRALHATGATSFSIGIAFPWGVSVALEWTP
jgi:hypothetical protein